MFTGSMRGRMRIAGLMAATAMVVLMWKVYSIQNSNYEDYNKIVLNQRSQYQSMTIRAKRGDIYDRNGIRLATSAALYNLILDPRQMLKEEDRSREVVEPTVELLCQYFGFDSKDLKDTVSRKKDSGYVIYKKDISYDDMMAFEEMIKEKNLAFSDSEDAAENKKEIAGVWFEKNYKRIYPYGSLACNVIGFSNSDGTGGVGGVEQYYNDELNGTNGRRYGYLDDEAKLERVVKEAEEGNTLELTIDSTIQSIVEKYLKEWKEGDIGSDSAACIVMDPNNGEILAMASTSSFDLNSPRTTEGYTEEEIYEMGLEEAARVYKERNPNALTLTKEQIPDCFSKEEIVSYGTQKAWNYNWRNICVSDTYEPGSVQKIITVAGGLEENIVHMEDEFDCEGHVSLTDGVHSWQINCVNRYGHGKLDVEDGIMQSCNVVMMNIAFSEESELFMKYQKLFGLGSVTGIDLPAETNTKNLGFKSEKTGRTTMATNSFGQNYNCTMIQMISAIASVVNGGKYYRPHVVKNILSADGTVMKTMDPILIRETVSESTCAKLRRAMYKTVESGTGSAAKVPGYSVGGKTGTAEKLPREAKKYLVSFCGFAPVEDPALVCYVIVDEPHLPGEDAAHSSFASGIFSKIMSEALPAAGILPKGENTADYKPVFAEKMLEGDSMKEMGEADKAEEKQPGEAKEPGGEGTEGGPAGLSPAEETEPVTKEFATDEYIEGPGGNGSLPDMISDLINYDTGTDEL